MAQASRLMNRQRFFNLVVTNVPGPQFPLYLMGREATDPFPMVPLAKGQGLGIAIMSYNGRMNFGLVGDFDVMHDIDDLAHDLYESLAELADAAGVELSTERSERGVRILVGVRDKVIDGPASSGSTWTSGAWKRPRPPSQEAAAAVGCDDAQIAKSLVFVADGDPVLCIASGAHRVDTDRLADVLDVAEVRQATPDEVRAATGFSVGGVPPFGHDLPVVVDEALLQHERVWAAGGDTHCLFEIEVSRLVECTAATRRPPWARRPRQRPDLTHGHPAGAAARRAGADEPGRGRHRRQRRADRGADRAGARRGRPAGGLPRAGADRLSARGPAAEDPLPRRHRGGARGAGGLRARASWRWWAFPSAPTTSTTPRRCWPTARWPRVYRKMHLPNYGVFDEQRYFQAGEPPGDVRAERRDGRAHHLRGHLGAGAAGHHGGAGGAEVIVNLSASPYHAGKGAERERMLAQRARDNLVAVLFCNAVGGQDELVFDGHSVAIDQEGEMVARAPQFEEALTLCTVDPGAVAAARLRDPRHRTAVRRERASGRPQAVSLTSVSVQTRAGDVGGPVAEVL